MVAADSLTPFPCSWQEPELPLYLCTMGEMEQLRQEAEQLKKQIAVTPHVLGTLENRTRGVWPGRDWVHSWVMLWSGRTHRLSVWISHLRPLPHCRAPRPPTCEVQVPGPSPTIASLMPAFPVGCPESLCGHHPG